MERISVGCAAKFMRVSRQRAWKILRRIDGEDPSLGLLCRTPGGQYKVSVTTLRDIISGDEQSVYLKLLSRMSDIETEVEIIRRKLQLAGR